MGRKKIVRLKFSESLYLLETLLEMLRVYASDLLDDSELRLHLDGLSKRVEEMLDVGEYENVVDAYYAVEKVVTEE